MPTAMSAMPPNTNNRRAPMVENVPATLAGIVLTAICLFNRPGAWASPAARRHHHNFPDKVIPVLYACWPSLLPSLRSARTKCWHYMVCEYVLRLNAFPMLQSSEVRDYG